MPVDCVANNTIHVYKGIISTILKHTLMDIKGKTQAEIWQTLITLNFPLLTLVMNSDRVPICALSGTKANQMDYGHIT